MGIYQHNEYRKSIREIIEDQKTTDKTVNFGSYAEASGTSKSYRACLFRHTQICHESPVDC